jgi:hypothetical protein
MPRELIARNLFGAQHVGGARRPLVEVEGARVLRSGPRLTQAHADVLMSMLHLSGGMPDGAMAAVMASDLEHELARKGGETARAGLFRLLDELSDTLVTVATDGRECKTGLVAEWSTHRTSRGWVLSYRLTPTLMDLLDLGCVEVPLEQRRALAAKPLAQWLQLYVAAFPKGLYVREAVELVAPGQPAFLVRRRVREAVRELERAGIGRWYVDEHDRVRRLG